MKYIIKPDQHNNYVIYTATTEEVSYSWEEAVEVLKDLAIKREHIFYDTTNSGKKS